QVNSAGGPDAVSRFECVKSTTLLPYGFVKILLYTYEELDYLLIHSSEQKLYEKMEPVTRRRYTEDMVVYPLLRNGVAGEVSNSGIERFPRVGGDCADRYYDYAKLFYADDIDLDAADFWFLMGTPPDPNGVSALNSALQKWLSHIAEYPDAYGHLALLAVPRFLAIGSKMCGHIRANISALKEEVVDLLMVIMDEINLDGCKVQFVVLGEPELSSSL